LSKREKESVKKRLEELGREIQNEQIDIITEKISEEKNSTNVVNICFQPFESSNSHKFIFWRTDPLYLSQKVNFDLALFSSESSTICLIECKANITTRLKKTAYEFQKKIDFVKRNIVINIADNERGIQDSFAETLNIEKPNFYFVLASELVDLGSSFDELIQLSEYPFDIWRCQLLALGGISIQRTPIQSKQNEEKNISHLTAYLDKIHSPAGNTIQICLSSSKYYLVVQSCINLRCLDFFTFKDFLTSFSIDLKDYEEFEKQFLFKLFVYFGKECSILKILEDTGDVFTSSYVIVNRRMKSKQLQKNIILKMAEKKIETDPEIRKRIEEEKIIIIQEIYEKKYKQKSLSDYMDLED
jgi:hypothetical protein